MRKQNLILSLVVILLAANYANADFTITKDQLIDKARGMWLGQMIANTTGRPTEGRYCSSPYSDEVIPFVIKGDPDGWPADDDTDIEYINLHILETYGYDCTPEEIKNEWRSHITSWGIYISNRQAWYLMGDDVLPPDTGSRSYNMHWYSIDSQITNETTGTLCPGMPNVANDLTFKFAKVTNDGFAVDAAVFYSIMYAWAYFDSDIESLINKGLKYIEPDSRSYQVISDVQQWYSEDMADGEPDWRATRQKLYDYYCGDNSHGRYYYWIESTANLGATVLALLYGNGDYKQTVQIGIKTGWDSDCNPATAGGIIGIIKGFSGLPSDLTDPAVCSDKYVNVYRPYLPDPDAYRPQNDTISNIASRIANLTEQNILAHGGSVISESPKTYSIPAPPIQITMPSSGPITPNGLVGEAIRQGVEVTATACVANYNSNNDRYNLNAIIDGINTNILNGHRPYYSYSSTPKEKDWYQVNFAQQMLFNKVVFYEGDLVWGGINTYCRIDDSRGGYFEDLNVEILKNGQYYTPRNIVQSEPLDKNKMYQTIVFEFDDCVGDAVRIVGTPGGTQKYTTILELEVYGCTQPGFYLDRLDVNPESNQRSLVESLNLTFSKDVLPESLDILINSLVDGSPTPELVIQQGQNGKEFAINFKYGDSMEDVKPLLDGVYELKINAQSSDGESLREFDNQHDGYHSVKFHRLFGDINGNGHLEIQDFESFSQSWLTEDFNSILDYNDDNYIDLVDFSEFVKRWNVEYTY